jgi:hypothetical protein
MNRLMKRHRTAVSLLAIVLAASAAGAAYAQIVNEVTVTGSSPGGTNDVTGTATESVTVQVANPLLAVSKSASDTTDVASPLALPASECLPGSHMSRPFPTAITSAIA